MKMLFSEAVALTVRDEDYFAQCALGEGHSLVF